MGVDFKMSLNVNFPIYIQIAKFFQAKVFTGELNPGEVIPSRRELSSELGVNLNTVQKAYVHMEEIGLIETEKNRYSKITDDLEVIENLKVEYIKEPLNEFLSTMKLLKIGKEQLLNMVGEYYDKLMEENL